MGEVQAARDAATAGREQARTLRENLVLPLQQLQGQAQRVAAEVESARALIGDVDTANLPELEADLNAAEAAYHSLDVDREDLVSQRGALQDAHYKDQQRCAVACAVNARPVPAG